MISTDELLRYSCQIQLPGFGVEKQRQLQQAKVLLAGAGGLGCPAAQYLVAAGVGTITIADSDTVSIGNLHRQILYSPDDVGLNKAALACAKLQQQNPHVHLIPFTGRIVSQNVMDIIQSHDLVIDCTDNFETRYLLNDACVLSGKPLVYGAIYQYEGQVAVWNHLQKDGTRSANYRDLFPEVNAALIPNCAEGGVIPTVAGIIGCMQAHEAIKLITRTGEILAGKILLLDVQTMQSRIIKTGSVSKVVIKELMPSVQIATITPEALKANLNSEYYELIDVRSGEERMQFQLGGKHIPVANLESRYEEINTGKPVVFYCASGKRSAEAVKIFRKYLPEVTAFSLAGGVKAWMEAYAETKTTESTQAK